MRTSLFGKSLVILGILIQSLIYAAFPVFAPFEICSPPGPRFSCDFTPRTALVYFWQNGAQQEIILFGVLVLFVFLTAFKGNMVMHISATVISLAFALAASFASAQTPLAITWRLHILIGTVIGGIIIQAIGHGILFFNSHTT